MENLSDVTEHFRVYYGQEFLKYSMDIKKKLKMCVD